MSSNCDSDGVPMDHDGQRMEDYLPHTAPFAIRTDVFQELFTGSGKDRDVGHLETEPARGAQFDVQRSSSGGIPLVDDFTVEDYVSSDEELPSSPVARVQPNVTSATVQAVLRSSKHERDALVNARNKLNSVLKFLKSKGYSEEQIYEEMSLDGFGPRMPVRDGFGLPRVSKADGNPFVDKMKSKLDEQEVFVELPKPVSAHLSEKKSEVPKVFGNLSQKNPTGDKPSPEVKSSERHSTSACPKVIRIWKPKEKLPVENIAGSSSASDAKKDTDTVEASHEDPVINVKANSESDWTEVKRKKSMSDCEASPSPPVTFKNLKAIDEIAAKRGATGKSNANVSPKRLTKSQKKRQKASGGIDPSSLS
ncbi:hypothetical protein ACET3Z_021317 [Daucus carota]